LQLIRTHHLRRYRIPALVCALAVLLCAFASSPFSTMGFVDDGPYILMTRTLAATGHIVYNGWAAPMLGWQLYLGAAFIKLFGFSFTAVRSSTLLVAMSLAFVLQRTLVRANLTERNATLGTLAFVLSPLYLMLSVTFMTDIDGLFAVVLCLYACLRALQSSTQRSTIAWLCFAVATNALCGTSRQIEWLGLLVMVPSTLWLLRTQRRVLLAGTAATLAGALFIFACIHWYSLQPYTQPEHLLVGNFPLAQTLWQLIHSLLDVPFLLLPLAAVFLPALRKSRPRIIVLLSALLLGYLVLALYPSHLRGNFPLEPTMNDWINIHGIFEFVFIKGTPPVFIPKALQILLTLASLGGLLSLFALLLRPRPTPHPIPPSTDSHTGISWHRLLILAAPFALANILLLLPRAATTGITERYLLGPIVVALPCLIRCYQERVRRQLPLASILLIAVMALFSITLTHNLFSFYRARVALVAELTAAGIPPTSVDNGWEYNTFVELQHAAYINNFRMVVPAHAYVPTPPPATSHCPMSDFDEFPHIHPRYGISFQPSACNGPAPFSPVHYSRWPYRTPGTLYVVNYIAPTKP
jgi:hypothetical protein